MERRTSIENAKKIMGKNFIGLEELKSIRGKMGIKIPVEMKSHLPFIEFSEEILEKHKNDCILILGIPFFKDGTLLTITKMRSHFGIDPEKSEPCFYNQDWYENESFVNKNSFHMGWYLIKKKVYEEFRGKSISEIRFLSQILLPEAVLCCYVFFCSYLINNELLWKNDFVWCSDVDANNDSIYVGNYIKSNSINKNGFEIHRYLTIRDNYSTINIELNDKI